MRPDRLASDLDPPAEVTGLHAGGLIPSHVDGPQEPEPPQQRQPVRALRRRGSPAGLQVVQESPDRADRRPRRIKQPVRLERIRRCLQPTLLGNHQGRQVPWFFSFDHGTGP